MASTRAVHVTNKSRWPLRASAALIAVLGWLALILQLVLTIQLATSLGRTVGSAVWQWLGYFTITTNLLVAAVSSKLAITTLGGWQRRPSSADVQGTAAMSIVVVGLIYNLVLRNLWQPQGWQWLADALLHSVIPALFVLHWWLFAPKRMLHWRRLPYWLIYPAAYLVYALIRGGINGWYPYPFIDVGTLGYARVALNAGGILLTFLAMACLLLSAARWHSRRHGDTD